MLFRTLNIRGAKVEIKSLEEEEGVGELLFVEDNSEYSISELTRIMFPSNNSSKSKSKYLQNTGLLQRLEQHDVLTFSRESSKKKYYRVDIEKARLFLKNWAIQRNKIRVYEEIVKSW